jgi:leader peptidase (prepilin peptidase) / N-methyltransferase
MDPVLAAVVFVFGLAFGSFLNVCIHRLPRRIELQEELRQARAGAAPDELARLQREVDQLSIVSPASACPKCHQPIRAYDNIPVVSWLLLRGRCRHCQAPITPRYIIVELLTAVAFLLSYVFLGARMHASLSLVALVTAKYCLFSFLIIGLTFIDAEWKLLPDAMTLPGLIAGLGFSFFVPVFDVLFLYINSLPAGGFHWLLPWPTTISGMLRIISFCESALGAVVGATFFYLVSLAYKYARGREGMGMGDVKLMAMIGAFLGLRLTLLTIFAASLAGSVFGLATLLIVWSRRTKRRIAKCREASAVARKRSWRSAKLLYAHYGIPFGVFLGPLALLSVYFGHALVRWYGGLF